MRLREPFVLLLICVSLGAYFRLRGTSAVSGGEGPNDPSQADLIVWSSENPSGQTWANLGLGGKIEFPADSGLNGKGGALTIRMKADGYRGCGLNWKGWFPADACDDASKYVSLVFHIRQVTALDKVDLSVSLLDNVKRENGDPPGNVLRMVGDAGTPCIDNGWRKVVLPLAKFAQNKPLRLDRLWGIDFSHNGKEELVVQIDRIGFSMEQPALAPFPERPSYTATAKLDLAGPSHPISDGIYGVCSLPREKLEEYGITITRWGGNTSSRYNWKLNADNGANDWYFKNRGSPILSLSENGYLKHIRTAQSLNATTYQTIPMLGWVAKDYGSFSYPTKKFGNQKGFEPGHPDIGNGIDSNGRPIGDADPKDTSIEAGPEFVAAAVDHIVRNAGKADGSDGKPGVKYWVLDNEPMLWHATHRDVRPEPLGYDELWERTVKYAEAIKKVDPTAKVAGFCSWGWTDLWFSAKDEGSDRYANPADRRAHGGEPLAQWFIRKCGDYKKKNGKSLIDAFDFHWYPQALAQGNTPYLGKGMDRELNELRLRSTRDLWDPAYTQESWIKATGDRKPTQVIRRVRQWIDELNPGMELCLGEYNFGGSDNITGGLAQADTFGILAREKVDLAFIWNTPEGTQNLAWQLFRNYDGHGGRFGERLLPVTSDQPNLAVYAAKRKDGATTVVAVNKNLGGSCDFKLDAACLQGKWNVWRFDQTANRVTEIPVSTTAIDGSLELKLPAASATMIVVK